MSNENIVDMSDQEFSDHVESLTPAEASAAADSFMRQATTDPAHPFNATDGKNHRVACERALRLREQAHSEDGDLRQFSADGEELQGTIDPEIKRICDEAMAGQAEKRNKLIDQAQADMDYLVSEGFDRSPIPDDLQQYQSNALKMQRLLIEGDHEKAGGLMKKELSELKAPLAQQQLFETFIHSTDLDPGLRETISTDILLWIQEARRAQKESYRDRY